MAQTTHPDLTDMVLEGEIHRMKSDVSTAKLEGEIHRLKKELTRELYTQWQDAQHGQEVARSKWTQHMNTMARCKRQIIALDPKHEVKDK